MADKKKDSYRNIMLSTMIFGGAQITVTLINVIRGKLVAMILGAAGIGLSSLLTNAATCIQQFALLGINQAGVREVSQAHSAEDKAALCRAARIIRTMILASALAGLFGAVAFSPLITRLSVDDPGYLIHFMMLGAVVFFNILGIGEYTILQGTRQYKSIAVSTVVMPLCGLLLGVPIYYRWGLDGIVPAMVLQSLIFFFTVRRFADRKGLEDRPLPRVSLRHTWRLGKGMIMLGMVMMAATLLGNLTTYAMSAFISNTGSIDDVGFYQAASTITMQCSALVFSAMATDYYPKLAGMIDRDMVGAHRLVNQQTEIVLLVIVPVSMIIISVVPFIITVFLTEEFQVIRCMMRFMGYAVVFKALCFPVDYMSFSKGDKRFFFWVEGVFSNVKTFLTFTLFYHYLGLDGLGYAALCSSVIDVAVSLTLNRWRYGFRLSRATASMSVRLTLMCTACLAFSFVGPPQLSYALMAAVTLFCGIYSYRQLDRRIGITTLIRQKLSDD